MVKLYTLFEHAAGYGLFCVKEFENIGLFLPQVEEAILDKSKFKKMLTLVAFKAFTTAASALENMNAVSEGILTSELSAFLESTLPVAGKKANYQLGVCDPKLGAAINETLRISVTHIGVVPEIIRGIRQHISSFVEGLDVTAVKKTELGLGHSYSRGKVKFNVNRVDNMIIQSIAILDQMDKDINTFVMRIKEWYSYHFPELAKIVSDNMEYAQCANLIQDRTQLSEEHLEKLEEVLNDGAKAQAVLNASRMSMGMDISEIDLLNIRRFAQRVVSLAKYRKELSEYLKHKMTAVAPNLSVLIGDFVGARLISHAGSLTNLAKYPASTVQILGAEKALFRALKTKGKTPKYGLIFHSSFITKADKANKGRISRYLANKCSIASRIDCFAETQTSIFGHKLHQQVLDRLQFYETGDIPRKNVEVMEEAMQEYDTELKIQAKKEKKGKKRKSKAMDIEETAEEVNGVTVNGGDEEQEVVTPKKKKKKKKMKMEDAEEEDEEVIETPKTESLKKKKKKKSKSVQEDEDDDHMEIFI